MAQPIVMPSFGMYTAEGKLVGWLEPTGAQVKPGQPILEIETEKATEQVVAPAAGILHQLAARGAELKEQALLGYILAPGEAVPSDSNAPDRQAPAPQPAIEPAAASSGPLSATQSAGPAARVPASPVARRLASEYGIDLGTVTGTGPGGRIVEADVKRAAEQRESSAAKPSVPSAQLRVRQKSTLSTMRRTIGQRLRQSLNTAVSLTLTREVEMDRLVAARQRLSARHGDSIPFDALLIYFFARALQKHSHLNAIIEGDSFLILDEVNIAFAVSVEQGLLVPVVRAADQRTVFEIARQVRALAERARQGKLSNAELDGGTATITNLGALGVDAFTPILNPPQSCILGVGRIQPRPVVRDQQLAIAQTCVLSLTFDHRVTDGAPAAQLLDTLACHLNDPAMLEQL